MSDAAIAKLIAENEALKAKVIEKEPSLVVTEKDGLLTIQVKMTNYTNENGNTIIASTKGFRNSGLKVDGRTVRFNITGMLAKAK